MKSSELLRILTQDGWYVVSQSGSHVKMRHSSKSGVIIFPSHGSNEVGKGLERKLLKQAGIKK
ncbi:MAG: type II toxin-antitoxin system HicA family toxin [Cyclobacteriaceae bacterium]|nr:type II toxin-antitoxin system HicA family toxin [Cyclobacteriaceae bacterium]